MDPIDDKGRLFGTINIIDALVVCLILAVVTAGATFVLTADDTDTDQPTETAVSVTVEITEVQPYVANAIPEGQIDSSAVTTIENKSIRPTRVVVADQHGELHERPHPKKKTVTLRLSLTTPVADGEIRFRGEPLQIGRELTLDLETVTVEGNVTSIQANR